MTGRAGRPQYDTRGVCALMTRREMARHYESLLGGSETIESHMHQQVSAPPPLPSTTTTTTTTLSLPRPPRGSCAIPRPIPRHIPIPRHQMLQYLNAEVAFQGCMDDLAACLAWARSTFFFTRVKVATPRPTTSTASILCTAHPPRRRPPTSHHLSKVAPNAYRIPRGLTDAELDGAVRQLCMGHVRRLADANMIAVGDDGASVRPLPRSQLR